MGSLLLCQELDVTSQRLPSAHSKTSSSESSGWQLSSSQATVPLRSSGFHWFLIAMQCLYSATGSLINCSSVRCYALMARSVLAPYG